MEGVEEIIIKEHELCAGCNAKKGVGNSMISYTGSIKSLRGNYCSMDCLEREATIIRKNIYAISEEDLPKSQ